MTIYAGDEMLAADDEAFGPFMDEDDDFGLFVDSAMDNDTAVVPAHFLAEGDIFWSESLDTWVTAEAVQEINGSIMVKDDSNAGSWHVFAEDHPVEIFVGDTVHI